MSGLTLGLPGELAGDSVRVSGSGAFGSKNAGSNIAYNINSMSLLGPDAGNYYLSSGALSGTNGVITPKPITVSGITANNKVYDGTTEATLTTSGSILNGVLAGDTVAFDGAGYSALFGDRNVGTAKSVTVTGLLLTGTDAGNYTLTQPAGLTASITPRPLTITAVSDTKTYDGTTQATVAPIVSGSLVSGDRFSVLGEQYASGQTGTGLALIPVVGIDDGNGGANYVLTLVDNNTGQIFPSLDLAGPGASNVTSRLNGDSGARTNLTGTSSGSRSSDLASSTPEGCNRPDATGGVSSDVPGISGNTRGHCAAGAGQIGLIQVVSTGIRLPPGLTAGQDLR
jgi:hypothetical protein